MSNKPNVFCLMSAELTIRAPSALRPRAKLTKYSFRCLLLSSRTLFASYVVIYRIVKCLSHVDNTLFNSAYEFSSTNPRVYGNCQTPTISLNYTNTSLQFVRTIRFNFLLTRFRLKRCTSLCVRVVTVLLLIENTGFSFSSSS